MAPNIPSVTTTDANLERQDHGVPQTPSNPRASINGGSVVNAILIDDDDDVVVLGANSTTPVQARPSPFNTPNVGKSSPIYLDLTKDDAIKRRTPVIQNAPIEDSRTSHSAPSLGKSPPEKESSVGSTGPHKRLSIHNLVNGPSITVEANSNTSLNEAPSNAAGLQSELQKTAAQAIARLESSTVIQQQETRSRSDPPASISSTPKPTAPEGSNPKKISSSAKVTTTDIVTRDVSSSVDVVSTSLNTIVSHHRDDSRSSTGLPNQNGQDRAVESYSTPKSSRSLPWKNDQPKATLSNQTKAQSYHRNQRLVKCPGTNDIPPHIVAYFQRLKGAGFKYGCVSKEGTNSIGCGRVVSADEYVKLCEALTGTVPTCPQTQSSIYPTPLTNRSIEPFGSSYSSIDNLASSRDKTNHPSSGSEFLQSFKNPTLGPGLLQPAVTDPGPENPFKKTSDGSGLLGTSSPLTRLNKPPELPSESAPDISLQKVNSEPVISTASSIPDVATNKQPVRLPSTQKTPPTSNNPTSNDPTKHALPTDLLNSTTQIQHSDTSSTSIPLPEPSLTLPLNIIKDSSSTIIQTNANETELITTSPTSTMPRLAAPVRHEVMSTNGVGTSSKEKSNTPTNKESSNLECMNCGKVKSRVLGDKIIMTCASCDRICHFTCLKSQTTSDGPWICRKCERTNSEKPKSKSASRAVTPAMTDDSLFNAIDNRSRAEKAKKIDSRKRKRDNTPDTGRSIVAPAIKRLATNDNSKLGRDNVNSPRSKPEVQSGPRNLELRVHPSEKTKDSEQKKRRMRSPSLGEYLDYEYHVGEGSNLGVKETTPSDFSGGRNQSAGLSGTETDRQNRSKTPSSSTITRVPETQLKANGLHKQANGKTIVSKGLPSPMRSDQPVEGTPLLAANKTPLARPLSNEGSNQKAFEAFSEFFEAQVQEAIDDKVKELTRANTELGLKYKRARREVEILKTRFTSHQGGTGNVRDGNNHLEPELGKTLPIKLARKAMANASVQTEGKEYEEHDHRATLLEKVSKNYSESQIRIRRYQRDNERKASEIEKLKRKLEGTISDMRRVEDQSRKKEEDYEGEVNDLRLQVRELERDKDLRAVGQIIKNKMHQQKVDKLEAQIEELRLQAQGDKLRADKLEEENRKIQHDLMVEMDKIGRFFSQESVDQGDTGEMDIETDDEPGPIEELPDVDDEYEEVISETEKSTEGNEDQELDESEDEDTPEASPPYMSSAAFAKAFSVKAPLALGLPESKVSFFPMGDIPAGHRPKKTQSWKEHYKGYDYQNLGLHKHRQCNRKLPDIMGTVTVTNPNGSLCTAEDDREDVRRPTRKRGKMTFTEFTGLDPDDFVPVVLGASKKLAFKEAILNKRTGGLSRHAAIYRVGRNVPGELRG